MPEDFGTVSDNEKRVRVFSIDIFGDIHFYLKI
jgi:hypothetical protein